MINSTEGFMQFCPDTCGGRCRWLLTAIAALWLLAILPANYFFGVPGIVAASISAASCLAGGCLTFWLVEYVSRPRHQAFAALLGTAIRGLAALIGLVVMQFFLELPKENYLIWLGLFYLLSLALETILMTKRQAGGKGG